MVLTFRSYVRQRRKRGPNHLTRSIAPYHASPGLCFRRGYLRRGRQKLSGSWARRKQIRSFQPSEHSRRATWLARMKFLRAEALVALLGHKDESVVEAAESELLSGSTAYWKSNLLFAITHAVPPSRSIPILAEVPLAGSSAQMRTSAAMAIYQTHSAAGIPPLLTALDDPDPQVAFAVMQGLGNLTRDYEWRPKSTEPDADWFRCLSHWREYRQDWK